jgi:prolyl-tRNA synthetase
MTTTCEAYIPASGRAIQGATSHNLGQNFGKMFDINFQDKDGKTAIPWQTSWGITTRTIGVMVMVHGDDTGLVLPPKVAPLQVVIVDVVSKKMGKDVIQPYCREVEANLKAAGIRVKYDDRLIYTSGWKYNHWEQKGVPIRVEVGPRDVESKQCRVCVRHDGEKYDFPVADLGPELVRKLEDIQQKCVPPPQPPTKPNPT